VKPYIHRTPILTNSFINQLSGAEVFFKCENLQKTGSFKVRGAANKITQLVNPKCLCTLSSGNHAQAVAYVAKQLGLKATIVMPQITPDVKKNAVRGYGADIVESGPKLAEMERESSRVTKEMGAVFVHPYNDLQIITGAATCALEIYQELKDLDYVVVPIGGGGFCSGTLAATFRFSPKTKVIGVEPFLARDAKDSLKKGAIQP
jgi:threonine dehydratase